MFHAHMFRYISQCFLFFIMLPHMMMMMVDVGTADRLSMCFLSVTALLVCVCVWVRVCAPIYVCISMSIPF